MLVLDEFSSLYVSKYFCHIAATTSLSVAHTTGDGSMNFLLPFLVLCQNFPGESFCGELANAPALCLSFALRQVLNDYMKSLHLSYWQTKVHFVASYRLSSKSEHLWQHSVSHSQPRPTQWCDAWMVYYIVVARRPCPPLIFSTSSHFMLWEAVSQTKYCCSPKIKTFPPPKFWAGYTTGVLLDMSLKTAASEGISMLLYDCSMTMCLWLLHTWLPHCPCSSGRGNCEFTSC